MKERFVKAMATYHLIEDDDRILVGLSGGKEFSVEALHVRMENIHYETDTSYLQQFCDALDVKLHVKTTRFEAEPSDKLEPSNKSESSDKSKPAAQSSESSESSARLRKQKQPCFLCSWNRRKEMFNLAQELGCNKIALGHHQDDIIHTVLLNLCFQSRFGTMPALLKMRKMPLTIIRPLCLIPEADIKAYAEQQGYQKQQKICPYETNSHRTDIKQIYDRLEQLNPEVRYSIWSALETDNKLIEE